MRKCLDDVCEATGWPVGHAYFRHEESIDILYPTDNWHLDDPAKFRTFRKVTEETIFEPGVGLPGRVMKSGEPAWIIDVTKDNNFPRAKEAADIGVKAGFALPVLVGSDVVAVLEFFSTEAVEPDDTLLQILINIGTQLGRVYEREKTSNILSEAKLKAEAANRIKSDFLAGMSHELRSPLTAIIGFSEMMKDEIFGPIGNEKYQDYPNDIYHAGTHLSDLISDLLDVSTIEAGKLELEEEPIEVGDIVENSSSIVQSRANEGNIKFTIEMNKKLPSVFVDSRRMRQILVNLLTNAIKFTPEGGSVRLCADEQEDGSLQFSVIDTGIGMDKEGIAKALEKFGQIDSEQARKHPGTGLGLPLTKELVEMHGGLMLIESVPGSGTTIKVLIPKNRVIHHSQSQENFG